MTPDEQARLPLTVTIGPSGDPSPCETIGTRFLPLLERRMQDTNAARAYTERNSDGRGHRVQYRSIERMDGVHTNVSILVDVSEPSIIGLHDDGIRERTETTRVITALHGLLRRIADAPVVPHDHPASWNRVMHSGLRMRERRGAPITTRDHVDVHHANALGMGGVVVDDGLGIGPETARRAVIAGVVVGGTRISGHVVDLSPDLCVPGPLRISLRDVVLKMTKERSMTLVIGGPARSQALKPLDPMIRMRLEAEHPWEPSLVRWIRPPHPKVPHP